MYHEVFGELKCRPNIIVLVIKGCPRKGVPFSLGKTQTDVFAANRALSISLTRDVRLRFLFAYLDLPPAICIYPNPALIAGSRCTSGHSSLQASPGLTPVSKISRAKSWSGWGQVLR